MFFDNKVYIIILLTLVNMFSAAGWLAYSMHYCVDQHPSSLVNSLHSSLKWWMKTGISLQCNAKCFIYKVDETTAQNCYKFTNVDTVPVKKYGHKGVSKPLTGTVPTYIFKHTPSKKWTHADIIHSSSQPAAETDSSLSSCCCCYLESHLSCHCSHQCPPLPPHAGHPSPPDSHRSALSASSCGPWCSASSSSSSAGRWQWPCGSSAWLRTPASVACSSCVESRCGERVSCHSPCGRAAASDRSGVRGCPGPCGGAVHGSPGTDRGWARTDSSCCGSTALRGGRSLHNHGSHSYTKKKRPYKLINS